MNLDEYSPNLVIRNEYEFIIGNESKSSNKEWMNLDEFRSKSSNKEWIFSKSSNKEWIANLINCLNLDEFRWI